MLQFHFNWKTLSVIAGITWLRFYFQLFPGAIKGPQIIEFLEHLLRHLRRPLLVIWDGLPAHRSVLVRDFVAAQGDRLVLEWLPGYAPELNPVEHIWSYLTSNTNCPTCARGSFGSSAPRPAMRCAGCVEGRRSSPRFGNKLNCSDVTILCNSL